MAAALIGREDVHTLISDLDHLEKDGRSFVGLNRFRTRLIDHYPDKATAMSDIITDCINLEIMSIYTVENPNDKKHPTRACRLNRDHHVVRYVLRT